MNIIWPININDAKAVQKTLREKLKIIPLKKTPRLIAGIDAAFTGDKVIGVSCLYSYPALVELEYTYAIKQISFPYIPGFLSFREGPAIIDAINKLKAKPDLIILDGQGIAHPRGFGIASHVGVLLNIPSIGCAKSRLIGEYKDPGLKKGNQTLLMHKGNVVGVVLRTKDNTKPLFISPGQMVDIQTSVKIILGCTLKYRIPEPLRKADILSKKIKKDYLTGQV